MSLEIANICYFTIFACSVTSGSITEPPLDTEAEINEPANFSCVVDKNANEIEWYHDPVGPAALKTVYAGEVVNETYGNRVTVSNCSDNELKLILTIRNVSTYDAGSYTCNDGNNDQKSAELSVFDIIPSSESCHIQNPSTSDVFIGNNDCGLKQDVITINCTFRYFGNKSPSLVWNVENQTSISPDVVLTNDNMNISSVQFDATVNKNVTCSIQYRQYFNSTEPASRFKWTTSVQVATFMNKSEFQNTDCSSPDINCTHQYQPAQCESMWVRENGSFVSSQELKLYDLLPGVYVCIANCNISSKSCVIQQHKVIHACAKDSSTEKSQGSSDVGLIVGTVIGIVCSILLLFVVYVVHKKRTTTGKTPARLELQDLRYIHVDGTTSNERTQRTAQTDPLNVTSDQNTSSANAGTENSRSARSVSICPEFLASRLRFRRRLNSSE